MENFSNILDALHWGVDHLEKNNIKDAKLSAELLLAEVLDFNRHQLYNRFDKSISTDQIKTYTDFILRRSKNEPLQYILGYTYFRNLKILVNKGVLIPRPETEQIVQYALSKIKHDNINVLDLCCGSGCIACSIAKEIPESKVVGIDISDIACQCAKKNAALNNLDARVKVFNKDINDKLSFDNKFDLVISNPPYVPESYISLLDREIIDYEPIEALEAGKDGLDYLCRILQIAKLNLSDNGILAVELFEDNVCKALEIARTYGFTNVDKIVDLAGNNRGIIANITK